MYNNAYVIDIECDELYPYQKNVWTIVIKKVGEDKWLKLNPFKENNIKDRIISFLFENENPTIVAHNGLGFDLWVLWKEFDIEFSVGSDFLDGKPVNFFDTLYASQYLLPDRNGGHSLESWGERFENEKFDYRQFCIDNEIINKNAPKGAEFKQHHPQMDEYCTQDVLVTEQVFHQLIKALKKHDTINGFKLGQKSFWLMSAQEFTGVKFDLEKAKKLIPEIEKRIQDIKDEVEPQLPPRRLKKAEEDFYRVPKNPFKKDGNISAYMERFLKRNKAEIISNDKIYAYGKEHDLVGGNVLDVKLPMSLDEQKHLKEYFLESGWEPTMYNVKKNSKGKAVRDENKQLILTSPKIQENGVICPNLLEIEAEIPKKVVTFMSLKNRLGVLKGWVEHPRIEFDGRLPASSSGIAASHRQRQSVVVNIPKAQEDVLLGKEFRSLFTVDDGELMIGCDQAALEARVQGHYLYKYDKGATAFELLEGDVHSRNCKAFFSEETQEFDITSNDFDKDAPAFKKYRSKSKNGYYCLIYGGAAPKLASTLGLSKRRGKIAYDRFWETNFALKTLKDNLEKYWEKVGNSKWIPAIDKRRLYSRSKHSLLNLLFQSAGAIIVDYSLALFDMRMGKLYIDELGRPHYLYKGKKVKRLIYMHDEFQVSVEKGIETEVSEIMEWCMCEAGKRLNLSIPLVGESNIGENWAQTH